MNSLCFPGNRTSALALIMVSSFAGCLLGAESGGGGHDLFAYDYSKDFDLKDHGTKTSSDVLIRDIDYSAYQNRHGRTKAYLVRPKGT